ncbi:MAG: hypothetical protein WBC91_17505, partial [Phototrophicaceae bacterium]
MEHKKKKLTGQQGELMRVLDITHDDLHANDNGTITPAQQASVLKRQGYQLKTPTIFATVFAMLGILMTLGIFFEQRAEGDVSVIGVIAVLSFFLAAAAIPALFAFWKRQSLKNELASNQVATTQGIAVVSIGENTSMLEMNGMKLNAPVAVLRRIKHLDRYVVHYLPKTNVILSMEHID